MKACAEHTNTPVASSERMELPSMAASFASRSPRYRSCRWQALMSRMVSSPSWMQSATARLFRIFFVPKASWIFLLAAVSATATGTTHSTARAMRQSQRNIHTPIISVEPMEANNWGT